MQDKYVTIVDKFGNYGIGKIVIVSADEMEVLLLDKFKIERVTERTTERVRND